MKKIVLASIFLLLLFSCLDSEEPTFILEEPIDFTVANDQEIQDYLDTNSLTATKTASGLYYIVNEQGNGNAPTANSDVTVVYTGYFTNGNVFDQSDSNGLNIGLDQVIPGWTEGIPFFNEGGSGVLLIPSHLAYGSFDITGIPGGSVLVFDIELLSIN